MTAIAPAKLRDGVRKALTLTLSVISVGLVAIGAGIASAAVLVPSRDTPLLLFPLFIAFMFFNTFIHEMGHAIAAWSVGRRVHAIVVGPVAWRVKLRKFAASSRLEGARRRWGGFVLSTPALGQDWNRGKAIIYAAGSLANFAAGAAAILYTMFAAKYAFGAGIGAGFALAAFSVGTYNLIPMRSLKGQWTDGGHLLQIAKGARMSPDDEIITRVTAYHYDGAAYGDWEPDFVRELEQPPDATGMRARFLLKHYLSTGDVIRAHDVMERLYAADPDKARLLDACRAFLVALVERDAEKAHAILAAAPRSAADDSFGYLRAVMVIAGLRGDWDKADAAVAKARALIAKSNAVADRDDEALFSAIVDQRKIPRDFPHPAPA